MAYGLNFIHFFLIKYSVVSPDKYFPVTQVKL